MGATQVRPLTIAEVQATTDLLTEVFATLGGPGWNVYTRYMRNQIRKFLEVRAGVSDGCAPRHRAVECLGYVSCCLAVGSIS